MKAVEVNVDDRRLRIANLDKVLYPAGRFTKTHVLDYYMRGAPYLLPHLVDRPVTLKRYPDGVFGEAFYEKNAPGYTPDWVKTFPVPRAEGGEDIDYVLINDRATLMWAASIASLEVHPFLHRAPNLEIPTQIVFDLDPGEGKDILDCARVALQLRTVLAKLKLESFAKVTGSKGLHVYVPLNNPVTYATTQPFAKAVAQLMSKQDPEGIVAEMPKAARVGKVFIDWSQNDIHKTTLGVYSLRANGPRPFVSMPVKWSELNRAITTREVSRLSWEAPDALRRLTRSGDLFAPLLRKKQTLPERFLALMSVPSGNSKSLRSLGHYASKRRFDRTPEPAPRATSPSKSRQGSRRRFVVQKHAASHLHYDLRLEMHGVLKSWALPKGMPLRNGERRSGFATEDHPIEYLEFEGVIPEGQYGGGTVMVWDLGTYEIMEGNYYHGQLTVFLRGRKLKGEWRLKRLVNDRGTKAQWLVIKSGKASQISARREARSVLTGRTLEQIAADRGSRVWHSSRGQ